MHALAVVEQRRGVVTLGQHFLHFAQSAFHGRHHRIVRVFLQEGLELRLCGSCFRHGITLARRIGRPYLEFLGLAHRTSIASVRSSPYALAEERAGQTVELARRHGWTDEPAVGIAYIALAAGLIWRRRLEEAADWVRRAERTLRAEAEPMTAIAIRYVRALLELARSRDQEVLATFQATERLSRLLDAPEWPLMRARPGGSLGWAGGGAVGAKLAAPERAVVSLVGDGSYLFGVPSCAQWVARRYHAPSLTVIYDNVGWAAPKFSTLRVYGQGAAAAADDFHVSFEPEADLPRIAAAAGGAYGVTIADPGELPLVLKDALAIVRGGRSAVVSVHLQAV